MKNLKSVLAVLAALCLLLCLTVPVFANPDATGTTEATTEVTTEATDATAATEAVENAPQPGAVEEQGDIKIDNVSDPDAVETLGQETTGGETTGSETSDVVDDGHNHEEEKPSVLRVILIVLEVIASVALILVVLVQSGKESGLSGALSGNSDSYMSKGNRATLDKKLATMTKWVALAWIVLTLLLSLV